MAGAAVGGGDYYVLPERQDLVSLLSHDSVNDAREVDLLSDLPKGRGYAGSVWLGLNGGAPFLRNDAGKNGILDVILLPEALLEDIFGAIVDPSVFHEVEVGVKNDNLAGVLAALVRPRGLRSPGSLERKLRSVLIARNDPFTLATIQITRQLRGKFFLANVKYSDCERLAENEWEIADLKKTGVMAN